MNSAGVGGSKRFLCDDVRRIDRKVNRLKINIFRSIDTERTYRVRYENNHSDRMATVGEMYSPPASTSRPLVDGGGPYIGKNGFGRRKKIKIRGLVE